MKTEKYKDKLFSVLGDSVSTLDGYSEPAYSSFYTADKKLEARVLLPEDTWWGRVTDALGGTLLVNNSISGSMVSDHPCRFIPSYGCSDERTSALSRGGAVPNVVMVFMGLNDWGHGVRLFPESAAQNEDPCVFSVAYGLMLDKLKRNYREAEIWCLTPPATVWSACESYSFTYYRGGVHIDELCEAIRRCAAERGCRVIDLFRTLKGCDTVDGYHPNAEGMKAIADAVIAAIQGESHAEEIL